MTIIIWDVDDVLNELTENWLNSINHSLVRTKQQLISPEFHAILGWSREKYLQSLDGYRRTSFADLIPNGSIQAFMAHNSHVVHLVLTATPMLSAHLSAEWTIRHFGSWVDGFLLAPSARAGSNSDRSTKADHISRLVSDHDRVVCIDDQPLNVETAQRAGATAILWPQPWNESTQSCDDALRQLSQVIS